VSNNPLGIVRGAAAIGAAIGVSPRRAYWLLERGVVPAVKEGTTWTSTLDRLRRFYEGDDPPNALGPAPAATGDRPHAQDDRLGGTISAKNRARTTASQAEGGGPS
jgi:hypothetical protein